MKRTLYLGTTYAGAVFVFIKLDTEDPSGRPIGPADTGGTRLAITYVEGPTPGGNARGGAGAAAPNLPSLTWIKYAPGWNARMVAALAAIADRWHLNDIRAGSPAQAAWLRDNPIEAHYPDSHYDKAVEALTAAGLNPDHSHLHDGKPYEYGVAWLYEELPADVVDTLMGFPNGGGRRPPGEWDR